MSVILTEDQLNEKYHETLLDIEQQTSSTEKALSSLLDELTGNDYDISGLKELQKLMGGY